MCLGRCLDDHDSWFSTTAPAAKAQIATAHRGMKKHLLAAQGPGHYCLAMNKPMPDFDDDDLDDDLKKHHPHKSDHDDDDDRRLLAPEHDTEIKSHRTSALLHHLILDNPDDKITLGAILAHLGERAFGFMIFFLAILNCLPMPPGFSTVTGIPILLLALQLLLGEKRPHLPKRIRHYELDRKSLAKAVRTIMPCLEKFEALFRPRWLWLSTNGAERSISVLMLLLTFILVIPMPPPFNFLPASAIAVMALGISERDGIVISIGGLAGIITLAMVVKFADLIFKILMGMFDYIIHIPSMIFG